MRRGRKRKPQPSEPKYVLCGECMNGWIETSRRVAKRCWCYRAHQEKLSALPAAHAKYAEPKI